MSTPISSSASAASPQGVPIDEKALFAKINRRVLLLPFLLGLISIIDRVNIGFAKTSLSADLGLSATAYGFGAGILFLGYFALEVPSNHALKRFGARVWLTRIAVTWGIICCLTAFVTNEWQFYLARFLLGAAEAGLFPGVVLYLTFWYPSAWRGKAIGAFMACVPAASIVGGPVAGWIMGLHQVAGLQDWQWLFLIEGLPAVVLGLLLITTMHDRPSQVSWLRAEEKAWLESQLQVEEAGAGVAGHVQGRLMAVLRSPMVWLFTLIYFCYACGSYGLSFFLPAILKGFGAPTPLMVGLLTAFPYVVGVVAMVFVSRHSDRTGERRLHVAIPMALSAVGLLGAGLTLQTPVLSYAFFILAGASLMAALGSFWVRPTRLLAGVAAASGIAIVNSFGNIGGFVGPYAFGWTVDLSGGKNVAGLIFLSAMIMLGAVVAGAIKAGANDAARPD